MKLFKKVYKVLKRGGVSELLFSTANFLWQKFSRSKFNGFQDDKSKILSSKNVKKLILKTQDNVSQKSSVAIVLHLYYEDLWPEFELMLKNSLMDFDLYITLSDTVTEHTVERIRKFHPEAVLFQFGNWGRDVYPFLRVLDFIKDFNYRYLCKIHSKRSLHRLDGNRRRKFLLSSLLKHGNVKLAKKKLDGNSIGLLCPGRHCASGKYYLDENASLIRSLCDRGSISYKEDFYFPACTMFWCRFDVILKLLGLRLGLSDFENEEGRIDGTMAHALERFIGLFVESHGMKVEELR